MSHVIQRAKSRGLVLGVTVLLLAALAAPGAGAQAGQEQGERIPELETAEVVRLHVPDRDALDELVGAGLDLTGFVVPEGDGLAVEAVLTPTEQRDLAAQGITVGDTTFDEAQWQARVAEVEGIAAAEAAVSETTDTITIQRADWFENFSGQFLSVEAKTSAGVDGSVIMTAAWDAGAGTDIGDGGSVTMSRFVDAGQYMYHRTLVEVDARPQQVSVTSSLGGSATVTVQEWIGDPKPGNPRNHYAKAFVSRYMNPTEVNQRIEELAAEFPDLAEVIELPNETNGYRRHAQALLGQFTSTAVIVTSHAWGHEGGNDLTIEFAAPDGADQPITVEVDGDDLTVHLASDGAGELSATAADVIAAINGDAEASELVWAHTYRGNAGNGLAQVWPRTGLSDFLSAPEEITREPFTPKMIRIGKHRDGSRVGVFAYSQEHAREWVTPIVAVETAERLLRNYAQDGATRQLVDNLDIFIIPSVNTDGGHYSFYDYAFQRKNMTNYCGPEFSDPLARNAWGVDNNRNYGAGNLWQGYFGASTSCVSAVFAGPGELSEPESRNVVWVADTFDNIRFSMNTHSHGGYFMWAPGAYSVPGREPLPRPSFGEETYFWEASEHILERIKEHRGTVIWPGRTGPVIDVLYSAAGNSADHLWYLNDIFAWNFEVGAPIWDGSRWVAQGFIPPWEEGFEQMMEFSDGLVGMFEVAREHADDRQPPRSELVPGQGRYEEPLEVRFEVSEPADIYYTLDGSRPDLSSTRYDFADLREGGETITVSESTVVKWFAVDVAGNVENNYQPEGSGRNHQQASIAIDP